MTAELRMAATVLVMRDSPDRPEFFMVRRHGRAAFMGGAHVFPGGAVDPADRVPIDSTWCDGAEHAAAQIPMLEPSQALAFHVAAVRELFEEAGILLARDSTGAFVRLDDRSSGDRFKQHRTDIHSGTQTLPAVLELAQLRLAADALAVCAHWVTPPLDIRRFDTRFFVARLPDGQSPAHDERETTESRWMTAAGAIAAAERHEIILPPPTWVTLDELAGFQTCAELLISIPDGRDVPRREPDLVKEGGSRMLIMPGDPAFARADAGAAPLETCFVWREDRWLKDPRGRASLRERSD